MKRISTILLILLTICLFVGCSSSPKEEEPSWNKEDYMLIISRDDNGTIEDEDDDILWLKDLQLDYDPTDGYTSITEIEFTNTKPETYTKSCDLTVKQNGNVMGYTDGTKIWIVGEHIVANPISTLMFYNFMKVTAIKNINLLDTSEVTNMGSMFGYCLKLESLDISSWDTSKVTDMNYMFGNCNALELSDISKWNTSKVTDMSYLFYGCYKITNLNLSKWDTSNVTNMCCMFGSCMKITELDLSSFDISLNTTRASLSTDEMFSGCGCTEPKQTEIKVNQNMIGDGTWGWSKTELGQAPWSYNNIKHEYIYSPQS